jgi:hypothetical protein
MPWSDHHLSLFLHLLVKQFYDVFSANVFGEYQDVISNLRDFEILVAYAHNDIKSQVVGVARFLIPKREKLYQITSQYTKWP